jgi:hypothetical protein
VNRESEDGAVRFPYLPLVVSQPIYSLGGSFVRHYPVFNIRISTPSGAVFRDGLLDSAADDTVFPAAVARQLGIDLSRAPVCRGRQAGGVAVLYRYATVNLRISDGTEAYEWQAIVGFLNAPMRWPLLGQAGVLQFFDAMLRGARRVVELLLNAAFTGSHTIH